MPFNDAFSRQPVRVALVAILLVGIICYFNSFWGVWILDDYHDVLDNETIRDLSTSAGAPHGSWRPVVFFSFAVNDALAGRQPWGYHLVNLVIHLGAALVLFDLIRRTLLLPVLSGRFTGFATGLGLVIALTWMVHPLQTESVTYVVQRYESLMGLFYFLTLYCLLRGATALEKPHGWYAVSVVSCLLGMGSKEVMITAPLLTLAYDRVFLASSFRQLLRSRGLVYVGLVATTIVVWVPMRMAIEGKVEYAGFRSGTTPAWLYLINETEVLLYYLRLVFWPDSLCLDYRWLPSRDLKSLAVPVVSVAATFAVGLGLLWRRPPLGFVVLSFFILLAPTSSFMPMQDLCVEHRAYLPLAPVLVLAILGAHALLQRAERAGYGAPGRCRRVAIVAATIMILALGALTVRRNERYHDKIVMYQDVMAKSPHNGRISRDLGEAFAVEKRLDEGVVYFQTAIRRQPAEPCAYSELGSLYEKLGKFEAAAATNRQALKWCFAPRARPPEVETVVQTTIRQYRVLARLQRYQEAAAMLEGIVKQVPYREDLWLHLAYARGQLGEHERAEEICTAVLQANPTSHDAHRTLALSLWQRGEVAGAASHFHAALDAAPERPQTHTYLGIMLFEQDDFRQAIPHFQLALDLQPEDPRNHLHLAAALSAAGARTEAARHLHLATQVDPQWLDRVPRAAWSLATTPNSWPASSAAVLLASSACIATDYKRADCLDALATAHAARGRFEQAVAMEQRALGLVPADAAGAEPLRARLTLFQNRQPCLRPSSSMNSKGAN